MTHYTPDYISLIIFIEINQHIPAEDNIEFASVPVIILHKINRTKRDFVSDDGFDPDFRTIRIPAFQEIFLFETVSHNRNNFV